MMTLSRVHHLVSRISGRLRPDVGVADIFAALFPCGSITGAPKVRELDSKFGVRHVANDCSPAAKKRVTDKIPGYRFVVLKPGRLPAIVGETCLTAYPLGIITSAKTPDVVVSAVAKALYENADKLGKFHPALRRWKKTVSVSTSATVPYHDAAIAAYKSLGVWTEKMDKRQAALLEMGK